MRAASVPPPSPAAELAFEDLVAPVEAAGPDLARVQRTVGELERRVALLEREVARVGQQNSAVPAGPAAVATAPATGEIPWDGGKRKRNIAMALGLSLLVGLASLLAAAACSHVSG